MNYVWEAALAADREGILREEIRFIPAADGSPYTEIVREMMNERGLGGTSVEVNPLYRFAEIFSPVFDRNLEGYRQTREALFRIFMQYMVQLDLRQGLSRQEYAIGFLLKDFLEGAYGNEAAERIFTFRREQLRQLLRFILKLYQCGSSVCLFREVMRFLYPGSLVYSSNDKPGEILIYIGAEETAEEQGKLKFLQGMFLPVHYKVFLFWKYHFGIIDVEETMELDRMVLF